MTDYQNELVMEHLDLVNWVIRTRISVPNRPLLTYDDFYAIGCEAICRAALKYQADSGEWSSSLCMVIGSREYSPKTDKVNHGVQQLHFNDNCHPTIRRNNYGV